MANKSYIEEKPEYIDTLKRLVEYEQNNKKPDHTFIQDTDYDSLWSYDDVGVHPTKLHQLVVNGFVEKVFDSRSTTKYVLTDRDEVRDIISEYDDGMEETGFITHMHEFPTENELPDDLFSNIIGYDKYKWIIKRGIATNDITNFILIGEKGTGKTVFLTEMFERLDNSRFIVASEASSAGVLDALFSELPMYFLVDEFDDMKTKHQAVFSSYAETGVLSETKHNKDRQIKTNIKTLATANNKSKIKDNIFDRFTPLEFEPYTYNEFKKVCEGVLTSNEGKTEEEARHIADAIWDYKGRGDIREAIQVARLSKGDPEEVIRVISN